MKSRFVQLLGAAIILAAALFLGACSRKTAIVQPPTPPPPAAKPTATLAVNRPEIKKGESVVLSWSTTDANAVTISGLGTVAATGTRTLTPADSTTYNLVANGPGGEANASARVTVAVPPPPAPAPEPSLAELFAKNVKDVYFDYDQYSLRPSDEANAQATAQFLAAHPQAKILIEGHCDERGSTEYNMALGDNRANATREFLTKAGVSADRIKVISYGKEKPFCTGTDESCWQQNRRAHFVLEQDSSAQGGN